MDRYIAYFLFNTTAGIKGPSTHKLMLCALLGGVCVCWSTILGRMINIYGASGLVIFTATIHIHGC